MKKIEQWVKSPQTTHAPTATIDYFLPEQGGKQ
jgi:hypothetical protein